MTSRLWEKTFWTAPLDYVTSTYIREYDISKANINVLLKLGLINQEQYNYFYRLNKQAREVMVGYFLQEHKDDKYGQQLIKGIREERRLFFEANDIQDYEVLSIKNDAVFLIEKVPSVTRFDGIEFINKETFTSFYKLDRKFNKEMYYKLDIPNDIEILEIKGMSDKAYKEHEPYMIDFLKVLFGTIETTDISEALNLLQIFSDRYIKHELDIGYYKRFDSISGYDTVIKTTLGDMYNINYLAEKDRGIIEIGYNYAILMNLYKYVANMYFSKK